MLEAFLRDRAVLYVCGSLEGPDREAFELLLEFDEELRRFVNELQEVETALLLEGRPPETGKPFAGLRTRLRTLVASHPQQRGGAGLVVSDPRGLVRWINPAFTELCGYSMEEVRGRKLGPLLQGRDTDQDAAGRLRRAVHECRSCRETLLNYHKDGSPYWVEIFLVPMFDDRRRPYCLIAREIRSIGPGEV